jgi:hypothetical protein
MNEEKQFFAGTASTRFTKDCADFTSETDEADISSCKKR